MTHPRDGTEAQAPDPVASPPDLLLVAALDELRARSAEADAAHATREAELEAAVAARTRELETAYEQAAREHGRLRDVVERLQDGILAVNDRFEIEFANPAAAKLLAPVDVSPGTPLPDRWSDFPLRDFTTALFERDAIAEEARITTQDQTIVVSGIPAYRSVAIVVLADISARERRERAEREFVLNAAHELRTPLAAILTAVEALQRAKDDPALRDTFLGHIERQSARLGRLAEALLTLARAQMGVEAPRQTMVELRPLLERVAAEIHPASSVAVDVECPPGLAVFGHPQLLEQALANLASNSAKHTSRGRIALRGRRASRTRVVIEVSDTGSGIAPAVRARATERFYRAGAEPGFGLGLAIARAAAETLSGRLELETAPEGGTTARLILRAAQLVTRG